MKRLSALISTCVALVAMGVLAQAATAAPPDFTTSSTKTSIGKYSVYRDNGISTPANSASVSGTANGVAGNLGDVQCTYNWGTSQNTYSGGFAVTSSFSHTNADDLFDAAESYGGCALRTVPAGTTPSMLEMFDFAGPTLYVGKNKANYSSGKLHDYYVASPQVKGLVDFDSFGSCGIDDMRIDPGDAGLSRSSSYGFYCNDWIGNGAAVPGVPFMRVDGKRAVAPDNAQMSNPGALPLSYSTSRNAKTGDTKITESSPFMACAPDANFPSVSCTSYTTLPVKLKRVLRTDRDGRTTYVTDQFSSTDGAKHTVSLYTQESFETGSSTDESVRLPGSSSFAKYMTDGAVSTVPGRGKPGTMFVRRDNSIPLGSYSNPLSAIVFAKSPTQIIADGVQSDYTLNTGSFTVPAKGNYEVRRAYDMSDAKKELAGFVVEDLDWVTPPKAAAFVGKSRYAVSDGMITVRIKCPKGERLCKGVVKAKIKGKSAKAKWTAKGGKTATVQLSIGSKRGKIALSSSVIDKAGNVVTILRAGKTA